MSVADTGAKAQEKLDNETAMFRRATIGVSHMSSDCANLQRATDEVSGTMLESSEGACSIECSIWVVEVSRLDAKNDQVECAFTGQRMMRVHFHDVGLPKAGSGTRSTRSLSGTVEGILILLEAKSMMTIDFDKHVGQRVLGTDNMSVKRCHGKTCAD